MFPTISDSVLLQDSLETVFQCLDLGLGFEGWCLVLGIGLLGMVSWVKNKTVRQPGKNTVGFQFFSTTIKKEASSYTRPPVQSDTSAVSPDAMLATYITAINKDDFNPEDRRNIYAEKKYIVLRQLIAKLFYIPATPRPPLWNVFFFTEGDHHAATSCKDGR